MDMGNIAYVYLSSITKISIGRSPFSGSFDTAQQLQNHVYPRDFSLWILFLCLLLCLSLSNIYSKIIVKNQKLSDYIWNSEFEL